MNAEIQPFLGFSRSFQLWSWSDVLSALNQCHHSLPSATIDKLLESVVRRVALSCKTIPSSSLGSSRFRSSWSTCCTPTWWFQDAAALNVSLIRMLMKLMVSWNIDHGILGRFLFFYQRWTCSTRNTRVIDKIGTVESVIGMLHSLEATSLSYKSLFGLLRVASSLRIRQSCRGKLENMIGSLLDRATLDCLLIPSPPQSTYLYDVDLVIRFARFFASKGYPSLRLKKAIALIDLYATEVAPDPKLEPSKFAALIGAIPDSVYYAVDLYLQVHPGLSEEEKIKLCSYRKCAVEGNGKLTRHMEEMQWRAMELEKLCSEMQVQMKKKHNNGAKFVPNFCS